MEIVQLGEVLGFVLHVNPRSLDVSVDDAALVECCQTTQDVLAERCPDPGVKVWLIRSKKQGVQRETGVVLLYQEELVGMHHEIPDGDDVRVAQAHDLHGHRTVLPEKFTPFCRVLKGWDNFENDEVVKLLIAGAVSLRQPPGVKLLLNRIGTTDLDGPLH